MFVAFFASVVVATTAADLWHAATSQISEVVSLPQKLTSDQRCVFTTLEGAVRVQLAEITKNGNVTTVTSDAMGTAQLRVAGDGGKFLTDALAMSAGYDIEQEILARVTPGSPMTSADLTRIMNFSSAMGTYEKNRNVGSFDVPWIRRALDNIAEQTSVGAPACRASPNFAGVATVGATPPPGPPALNPLWYARLNDIASNMTSSAKSRVTGLISELANQNGDPAAVLAQGMSRLFPSVTADQQRLLSFYALANAYQSTSDVLHWLRPGDPHIAPVKSRLVKMNTMLDGYYDVYNPNPLFAPKTAILRFVAYAGPSRFRNRRESGKPRSRPRTFTLERAAVAQFG